MRHLTDNHSHPKDATNWTYWFEKHFGQIGRVWWDKWIALKETSTFPQTKDPQVTEDVKYILAINSGNSSKRKRSYLAAKNAEMQHGLSLMEVATQAFHPSYANWDGGYGGPAWHRIAETIYRLWHATDLGDIVHLIDTAFALHHNNDIVFNKNHIWQRNGDYAWIQSYLDYKWAAYSPVSLLGLASKALQELLRSTGFCMKIELSPKQLENKTEVLTIFAQKTSPMVKLKENGSAHPVQVRSHHGDFFQSVVVKGPLFSAQKLFGKYSKTLNLRVYSLEEFLARYVSEEKKDDPLATQGKGHGAKAKEFSFLTDKTKPKKSEKPSLKKDVMAALAANHIDSPVLHSSPHAPPASDIEVDPIDAFTPALSQAYEKLTVHLSETFPGLELGNFLASHNMIRFRIKNVDPPLRFFFQAPTASGLRFLMSKDHEANPGSAKAVLVLPTKEVTAERVFLLLKNGIQENYGGIK